MVDSSVASRVVDLPLIHRDPFDRLLIAQAIAEPKPKRVLGRLRGQIVVPDNFDQLYEEEIRELFEKGC